MRTVKPSSTTALVLVAGLLATPAAMVCAQSLPMAEPQMACHGAPSETPAETPSCTVGSDVSFMDCCVEQTATASSGVLGGSLVSGGLDTPVELVAPPAGAAHLGPLATARPPDCGRYTLFSSFLL